MTVLEHVEVDALKAGMPVVLAGQTIGHLEDVIPQPDRVHALRLITRRDDGRLVAIPIDWVRDVRDGTIELWVSRAEIDQLPEYVPPIPAEEARRRVESALQQEPSTRDAGITVTERNGMLELRGTVADNASRTAASDVARGVRGVGPVRNLLGTSKGAELSAAGYGYPWLRTLLERTTGIDFDIMQVARIEEISERKLIDLFDVAEDIAAANGRARVQRHDLPLTKGLQILLLEVVDISREFQLDPLLVFLADAGIRAPFEPSVREDLPRLMAALLILTGRMVSVVESSDGISGKPTAQALDRVEAALDLTL
jgi:hypothetical protein